MKERCKYCQGDSEGYCESLDKFNKFYIFNTPFRATINSKFGSFSIKYCPKCGRKLEDNWR